MYRPEMENGSMNREYELFMRGTTVFHEIIFIIFYAHLKKINFIWNLICNKHKKINTSVTAWYHIVKFMMRGTFFPRHPEQGSTEP